MRRKSSRVVSENDPSSVKLSSEALLKGGFVVVPTDTIYGLLADALNYEAVSRLQKLRRPSRRPFLVLVPDVFWVKKLGLVVMGEHLKLLSIPGLTLVLRKRSDLYHWLGRDTVAVRVPRRGFIFRLLKELGRPVVAPSVNLEGKPPARNVREAVEYFGGTVSLYVDGGSIEGRPSTVVSLEEGRIKVLRSGVLSSDSLKRLLKNLNLHHLSGIE